MVLHLKASASNIGSWIIIYFGFMDLRWINIIFWTGKPYFMACLMVFDIIWIHDWIFFLPMAHRTCVGIGNQYLCFYKSVGSRHAGNPAGREKFELKEVFALVFIIGGLVVLYF